MPASETQRNMRTSFDRSSPGARKSAASPATNGTTPMPMASEPAAQSTMLICRCLYARETVCHASEWWLPIELMTKIAPKTSTTSPIQSPVDHLRRCSLARSLDHHAKIRASTTAAGMTASSPRTAGAKADARTAPAHHRRLRVTSALAMRKKHSAAHGYANVSSTMYDEYASEGITAAPAAARSAALRPTSSRARKYVGNTTDVMTMTSKYLIASYAFATSSIRQNGAVTYE